MRGHLLIELDVPPKQTAGGLVVPPEAAVLQHCRSELRRGQVVALGEPALTRKGAPIPFDCEVGDRVHVRAMATETVQGTGPRDEDPNLVVVPLDAVELNEGPAVEHGG